MWQDGYQSGQVTFEKEIASDYEADRPHSIKILKSVIENK